MDKLGYKEQYGIILTENSKLKKEISELKERVNELETELYFEIRNKKISNME
tara:strand:+ start:299 stop:454 length:156 start_codon:yes stop_codon:yes gene_type:complete